MRTIPEQLTDIYLKHENWHAFKMPYNQALRYHEKRYKDGTIQVYEENGEVLGYYERHFLYNVCFFDNTWIKNNGNGKQVFKELQKQFFETLPKDITHIIGHRNNIVKKVKISKWRKSNGRN